MMRKLLVVLAIFAMLTGVVFADITVAGTIFGGANLFSTNTGDDDRDPGEENDVTAPRAGITARGRLRVEGTSEDGKFGGLFQIETDVGTTKDGAQFGSPRHFGWWKPIDQLKIQLGQEGNGEFGLNDIVGWGFHANDAEDLIAFAGYNYVTRNAGFFPGFDALGAYLFITPAEGLAINVGIPFVEGPDAGVVYRHTVAQLTYSITNVGRLGLTFQGGSDKLDGLSSNYYGDVDVTKLYASFLLTPSDAVGVNIGFKYTLAADMSDLEEGTYQAPLSAGLGISFSGVENISLKARVGALFAGSIKTEGADDLDLPFTLGVDILPSFDLGGLAGLTGTKLFLNAGILSSDKVKQGDSELQGAIFDWYVNPYLTITSGPCIFYAGVAVYSVNPADGEWGYGRAWQFASHGVDNVKNKDLIGFAIPIGIAVSF